MYNSCGPQTPNYILAVHGLGVATGDAAWLASQLGPLEAIAAYMLGGCGVGTDGIFVDPGASGLADGGRHASNWFDIIEFGHQDAYNSMLGVLALEALDDIYTFLGNASRAAFYRRAHAVSLAAVNAVFWNESLGIYHDWVDIGGGARSYAYVDVDLLAIMGSAATSAQADAFLGVLDTRYVELAAEFNLSDTDIWSVPCSLYPLATPGDSAIPQVGYRNPGLCARVTILSIVSTARW